MTKEDFDEWTNNPLTKEYHQFLSDYRSHLMEMWVEGKFSAPTMEASVMKNLEAMAKAQCYKDLVDLEFDDISKFYNQGEGNVPEN